MSDENNNGWVKLYSPENALVTIPLDLEKSVTPEQAVNMLTSVRNLIAAGFSVNEKGLDEGELIEEVAYVERRTAGDDTPIIDFYSPRPRVTKKIIHTYLNTEEQVKAFEQAAGIKLADIPPYDGDIALDKESPKADKYIVKLPHPIKVVFSISPKWKEWKEGGGEGKEPMKRILHRYETTGNGSTPPQQPQEQKVKMTFATAREVLSPAGNKLSTLTKYQLEQLSNSQASNVTAEMREAAKVILKNLATQK